MQKENFTIDALYKGPLLLECMVEKYKKPGSFSMLGGNKQKKWLILDLSKKEFRYQPEKGADTKAKSIIFTDVVSLKVDLSKPGKYYVDMLTKDRPYRFKFLNIDSWVLFTEALRHVKNNSQEPLFKSTESYLTTCIKYHEQFDGPSKTSPSSPAFDPKPEQSKVPEKAEPVKTSVPTKTAQDPTDRNHKAEDDRANQTHAEQEVKKIAVKSKQAKLDSDSDSEEQKGKQHNEIVKKRKNI